MMFSIPAHVSQFRDPLGLFYGKDDLIGILFYGKDAYHPVPRLNVF